MEKLRKNIHIKTSDHHVITKAIVFRDPICDLESASPQAFKYFDKTPF